MRVAHTGVELAPSLSLHIVVPVARCCRGSQFMATRCPWLHLTLISSSPELHIPDLCPMCGWDSRARISAAGHAQEVRGDGGVGLHRRLVLSAVVVVLYGPYVSSMGE